MGRFGIDIKAENQVVTVILISIHSASLVEHERNVFRHVFCKHGQRHDVQSYIAEYLFLFSCATVAEWGHFWAGRRPASLAGSILDF